MAEPNRRLIGVKQELTVSKSEFSSFFEKLEDSITVKFSDIDAWLNEIEKKNIKKSVTEEVNKSIMSIKNTIIDALKEENLKLQNKVTKIEDQLSEIDQKSNNLDQYNRRNNLETNVTDDELEGKLIDIFSCLGIEVKDGDIEDCDRLGYANPKNTIVRFVNWKFCDQVLDKKIDFHKLESKRFGFNPVKTLYFSENLIPLNQWLASKCRELKRSAMICSTWSARGAIRISRTANEKALLIKNDNDLKSLYPEFVFRDR